MPRCEHDADQRQREAPAVLFGETGEQRQEYELSGRDAGGEDADHKAAARHEPACGDRRAQYQRGHAGAEPDHDAPQQHQLPDLRHHQRGEQAGDDDELRGQRHVAQAVAVHQRGRERRHQPEQDEADRQRRGDFGGGPAKFLLQRHDEDARRADRAGGDQRGEEGDADHHPAVMDIAAGERGCEPVRDHGAPGVVRNGSLICLTRLS